MRHNHSIDRVFIQDVLSRRDSKIHPCGDTVIEIEEFGSLGLYCVRQWSPILFDGAMWQHRSVIKDWNVMDENWYTSESEATDFVEKLRKTC